MKALKYAMASAWAAAMILTAAPTLAAGLGGDLLGKVGYESGYSIGETVDGDSLPVIIGNVIRILLGVLGGIFLVLMVYAGYLWMTARGDAKTVEKAKDIIKQAIIGIIVVTLAYAITGFVVNAVQGAATAS